MLHLGLINVSSDCCLFTHTSVCLHCSSAPNIPLLSLFPSLLHSVAVQWHKLDRSEQAKYYELAREERALHMQMYPGWSARDNYAVHKKRKRKLKKQPQAEEAAATEEKGECRLSFFASVGILPFSLSSLSLSLPLSPSPFPAFSQSLFHSLTHSPSLSVLLFFP